MRSQRDHLDATLGAYAEHGPRGCVEYWTAEGILAPDFRSVVQPDMPNGGVWEGVEGFERLTEAWLDVWDVFEVNPREYIEHSDGAWMVLLTQTARTKGGLELRGDFVYTFIFDGEGRLREYGIWADRGKAEESLAMVGG